MSIADHTPAPPYYAVIFTSTMKDNPQGYESMANKMLELAQRQEGFLGIESARDTLGITVSYWRDIPSIQQWKQNLEHQVAQKQGQKNWYQDYKVRIARVEKDYGL